MSAALIVTKACSKCREAKPREEFHLDKSRKDGLQLRCKACKAAYRAENRDKAREYSRAYHAENREEIAERNRAHYAENREEILERQRAYREGRREEIAERQRAYHAAHPHIHWRRDSARRLRAHGFPEAAERALQQTFTREDVIARYGDHCHYCIGPFEHLDHYVALKNGGEHTLENARSCCVSCNTSKSDLDPDEFERVQALGDDELHSEIVAEIARWMNEAG